MIAWPFSGARSRIDGRMYSIAGTLSPLFAAGEHPPQRTVPPRDKAAFDFLERHAEFARVVYRSEVGSAIRRTFVAYCANRVVNRGAAQVLDSRELVDCFNW